MLEVKKLLMKLMNIGYSLVHTKDYTDIFIDLEELVISPWFAAGLTFEQLEIALTALLNCYSNYSG